MEFVARGAEAILYKKNDRLIKERIKKGYRIKQIDEKLRKERTKLEASLLSKARRAGVATPRIVDIDEKNFRITMEFIDGNRLKEFLNEAKEKAIREVCYEVGKSIGKLHSFGIIHGDLTTSNMILKNDKIYFIDFGLGFFSRKIEDQAVDMNLLFHALKSTHFKILNLCWHYIVKGYKKEYKNAELVLKRVKEIEKRVRYAKR
jgi:Kae1-associated kinase Bud32